MTHNEKVLIISPHLDDETIGVGGTLLYHQFKKQELYWINVALPANSKKRQRRFDEQRQIADFFCFEKSYQLNFISSELEGKNKDMINEFSKIFNEIKANIVYLPNWADVHADHRYIFNAAYSCTKNFRFPFIKKILMYETLSETEFAPCLNKTVFTPNVFVDISKYFNKKMEAMKIYHQEIMKSNFPRSLRTIEALACYRGSRIGVKYAEAFQLLLEIH